MRKTVVFHTVLFGLLLSLGLAPPATAREGMVVSSSTVPDSVVMSLAAPAMILMSLSCNLIEPCY